MTKKRVEKYLVVATLIGVVVGAAVMWTISYATYNNTDRQTQVREIGSSVMPFDLDRTTHVFTKTTQGGTEEVKAKDPADKSQIDLARGHLREEATKFSKGNFDDPATIHGANMPGLATLKKNASNIQFAYADIPDGGKITYTTTDQANVDALHMWFDAQTSDHGKDAHSGMKH